ncbi:hypothetical protein M378DRAFT_315489 [Amanita muscaria Koide BX008]|uniref:Uncharacterized protein n=1 Tax=Amanita muscaria (strain Koide BX008) TaxID=946122 RepID=A0A0C2SWQ8_AMAMK|nr:hypothetical protein M378DRAFT_315489 [Amanita muscaria Koide BX008]
MVPVAASHGCLGGYDYVRVYQQHGCIGMIGKTAHEKEMCLPGIETSGLFNILDFKVHHEFVLCFRVACFCLVTRSAHQPRNRITDKQVYISCKISKKGRLRRVLRRAPCGVFQPVKHDRPIEHIS